MGSVLTKRKEYRVEVGETVCKNNEKYVIERVVCGENDIQNGEMKEFEIGQEGKVLLVKENGTISALGTKCTHYGAPLIKGVLRNGQIRCPWHGACFNSSTGDIEDFPGLDSLPCYSVDVEHGQVKVRAPVALLKKNKRTKDMVRCLSSSAQTFVVIGGGGASQTCMETLRQEGFTGKLILITKEKYLPYDRPKLSKALDSRGEDLCLRKIDFFKCADITVMLETSVTSIDPAEKCLTCDDGKSVVKYDKIMIATGGVPLMLDIPGCGLKNVCLLRTPSDGNYIAQNSVGKSVVIIGSSFIGMEVASFLLSKASSVNIVCRSDVPFGLVFGEKIGRQIKKMFEEKGVVFHTCSNATQFVGKDDVLSGVELSSGCVLPADICIVGIGVRPATDFLKSSGIAINDKGFITVDEFLKTSLDDVYACGDIVEFPLSTYNKNVNISHWQIAESHGHTAALNMLDMKKPLRTVPFFWSMMCGKSFRYAGYGNGYDDIIIHGNVDDFKFIAHYCVKDSVVAVCTLDFDPVAAQFASGVLSGKQLIKQEISKDAFTWYNCGW